MLKDLQERIDAAAQATATKAWKEFWKNHPKNGSFITVEGMKTHELLSALKEIPFDGKKSYAEQLELVNGLDVDNLIARYGELLKAAVYVNEKARLEGELVELAGKLYDGEILEG